MISLATETLLPLRDVPGKLPIRPGGKKIHVSAIYRWINAGIGGVVLETIKVGGQTCTSMEALQRFVEKLSVGRAVHGVSVSATVRAESAADRLAKELGM